MRNISSTAAFSGLAALALTAGIAMAQADDAPAMPANGMSMVEIITKVEGQGYKVRGIEIDDGAYEIKAFDADGKRVEANLDPVTGEPRGGWSQDD